MPSGDLSDPNAIFDSPQSAQDKHQKPPRGQQATIIRITGTNKLVKVTYHEDNES